MDGIIKEISKEKIIFETGDNRLCINDLICFESGQTTLIGRISCITVDLFNDAEINDWAGVELDKWSDDINLVSYTRFIVNCMLVGNIKDGKFMQSINDYIPLETYDIYKCIDIKIESMLRNTTGSLIEIGKYQDYNVPACLDANKLFQRHLCLLGNTGSGKSETITKIMQEISKAGNAKVFILDMHGEYSGISFINNNTVGENLKFPIYYLNIEDIIFNILKLKADTATGIISAVKKAYTKAVTSTGFNVKINKPYYFKFDDFYNELCQMNEEMVSTGEVYKTGDNKGKMKLVKGENNGKLTTVIQQFENLKNDSRYSFLFESEDNVFSSVENMLGYGNINNIDLSQLPHDMAVIVAGILSRIIYSWQLSKNNPAKSPVLLVCDEAHIYIPNDGLSMSQKRLTSAFTEIAKEGRKFGMALMVASQRPSELNKTILAQCSNFIVLKLNDENDKNIIKNMIPDGNASIIDETTMFSPGDCFVIGDAAPITLKIHIDRAEEKPCSSTINTWDVWNNAD